MNPQNEMNLSKTSLITAADRQWAHCPIERVGGVPTFIRGGSPWVAWGLDRPYLKEHFEAFERLYGAGLRHVQCEATSTEDIYHPELRFWHGPGQFDGSAQDRYFQRVASICPDALFQLRLFVGAPDWWLNANPDHRQVYHEGATARDLQNAGIRQLPSLASAHWMTEACVATETYVSWLVNSGWSRKVFSILVCYGITWEWGLLGSDGYLDYSHLATRRFRDWLRKKYATREALSNAWGRSADFEESAIPSADRRAFPGGEYGLRTVPEFQDVIDYQQMLSDMNVDLLLALAATIKRASDRQVPVGTFYGYTLTAREQSPFTGYAGAGGFQGGHHALGRVLRSPDIDYVASPYNYANRELGTGFLFEHVPLASIHAHGKAFFDENDLYTHSCRKAPTGIHSQNPSFSLGSAATLEDTMAYLRWSFAQAVVRGKHSWFIELAGWLGDFNENYSDPEFLGEVARLNSKVDQLLAMDRSPVAQIAFVIDEKSVAHLTLDHKGFLRHVYRASVNWGHCGAPFDLMLLEDLLEGSCGPYRLVVPACLKSEESVQRMIDWQETTSARVWWDKTAAWYPADQNALLAEMEKAQVHRYVDDGSIGWANASMVFVQVADAGERKIHFRHPCHGVEFFSGKTFTAPQATSQWSFEKNGTALFLQQNLQ